MKVLFQQLYIFMFLFHFILLHIKILYEFLHFLIIILNIALLIICLNKDKLQIIIFPIYCK